MIYRVGERILLVLWIGSLWTIGYVVAPTLFAVLDDRSLAGELAGRFFTIETWIGLGCGTLLLVMDFFSPFRGHVWRVVIFLMMSLLSVSEFLLRPAMDRVRQTLADGGDPTWSFGQLHQASAILYLLVSALAVFLIAQSSASQTKLRDSEV